MAITRTRTRTQSTLDKLAHFLADINGELKFVESLLAEQLAAHQHSTLQSRRSALRQHQAAMVLTLQQFDPSIDPTIIGCTHGWRARYAKGRARAELLRRRYLESLA